MPPTIKFDVVDWQRQLEKDLEKQPERADWPPGEATRRLLGLDPQDEEVKKQLEELRKRIKEQHKDKTGSPEETKRESRP